MGDETTEFASRYAVALKRLERFAASEAPAGPVRARATDPVLALRDALEAVEAVHGTSTQAVRGWPEKQRRVLAQVAALRDELDRKGASGEARRLAAALVAALEPAAGRRRRRAR
ncbi:MAG TPA: hypothetical protein VLD85_04140 [Anaeromyxobacteraceae bacterium]|nr:hypothetical protein [Anaeromyxobacteraceae bacterium]